MATSITQYGITWTFATDAQVGQYVNGDYWVVGPITITGVTPAQTTGRNGSMINPPVGKQSYDDRISGYDAGLLVTFPKPMVAGQSLVTATSIQASDVVGGYIGSSWHAYRVLETHCSLKTAAVLTVVSTAPATDAFRPPMVGTSKPTYRASQINYSILSQFASPADSTTLLGANSLAFHERGFQRPWLTHLYDYTCREMHPCENMLNYHREIGEFLSTASLLLMTELASTALINGWIQTGIDHYATITQGAGDSACFEWQAIFTGLLLGDETMARVWLEGRSLSLGRSIEKFYYWGGKTSTTISSVVPAGQTWTGATVFFRKQTANGEHEHLHPSEWAVKVADGSDGSKNENYRQCCDVRPHLGMALTSCMLNAQSYWTSNVLRDYLLRWMTEPFATLYAPVVRQYYPSYSAATQSMGTMAGAWKNAMWALYGGVVSAGDVPSIVNQPKAAQATAGSAVTLSVTASGTAPFTYQWRKNGSNITGATSQSYTIAAAQVADSGSYSVSVSNISGTVNSLGATVIITASESAPSILSHPTAQTVREGVGVSWAVTAAGTAPISYQWFFNGNPISGATSASYVIPSATAGNGGVYAVKATNATGSTSSPDWRLTVTAMAGGADGFLVDQTTGGFLVDSTTGLPLASTQ